MTTAGDQVLPPVAPVPRPLRVPMSPAQARLWFLYRLDGPSPTYNVPLVWRVTGPLDVRALAEALGDVQIRHESLRTVFGEDQGRPFQRVIDPSGLASCLTVRLVTEADLDAAVRDACLFCFDLSADLPFRAWLFHGASATSTATLVLLVHHIAVDGWSLRPLLADLGDAYAARRAGAQPTWPELPVQYADYSLWQAGLLAQGGGVMHPALRADLDFWLAALADMPADAAVPADHPRSGDEVRPAAIIGFSVGADVRRGLLRLARQCRTSLFVTLHAVVSVLLHDAGAGADVPIGVPVAGRESDQLDDLVGMFVNTVILRADVAGEPTLRQLVTQLAHRDLDALAHTRIPFDQVMNALGQRGPLGPSAGFRIMMGLEQESPAELKLVGLDCAPEPVENETAKCDIDFMFVAPPGKPGTVSLSGCIQYDCSAFEAATIQALSERLVQLLGYAGSQPDAPLRHHRRITASVPREETVELLTELFADCLARSYAEIRADDDFFDLGGDQLAVTRLVNRIRGVMDIEFCAADLRRMRTVAAIAAWVDQLDEAAWTS